MALLHFTAPSGNYRGLWFPNLKVFQETSPADAQQCLLSGARASHLLHNHPRLLAAVHAVFEGFLERFIMPFQISKNTWQDLFNLTLHYPWRDPGDFTKLHTLIEGYYTGAPTEFMPAARRNDGYDHPMKVRWVEFLHCLWYLVDGLCSTSFVRVNPFEDQCEEDNYLAISEMCVPRGVRLSDIMEDDREHYYTGFATTGFREYTAETPFIIRENCQPTLSGTMNYYSERGDTTVNWVYQLLTALGATHVDQTLKIPSGHFGGWMRPDGPLDRADTLWDGTRGKIVPSGTRRLNLDCLWTMQAVLGYMVTNFAKGAAKWRFKNETTTRTTRYFVLYDGTIMSHRTEQTETTSISYDEEMRWKRSVRSNVKTPSNSFDPAYIHGEAWIWVLGVPTTLTQAEVDEREDIDTSGLCFQNIDFLLRVDLSDKAWWIWYTDINDLQMWPPGSLCDDGGVTEVEVVESATVCLGVADEDDEETSRANRAEWPHAPWWPMADLIDRGFVKQEQMVLAERLVDFARWMYKYEGKDENGKDVREWRATYENLGEYLYTDCNSTAHFNAPNKFRVHKVESEGSTISQNTPNEMLRQVAQENIEWVRQRVGGRTEWMPESFDVKTTPGRQENYRGEEVDLEGSLRAILRDVRAKYRWNSATGVYELVALAYHYTEGMYDYGWLDFYTGGDRVKIGIYVGNANYIFYGAGANVPEFNGDQITIKPSKEVMVGADWDFKFMPVTIGD